VRWEHQLQARLPYYHDLVLSSAGRVLTASGQHMPVQALAWESRRPVETIPDLNWTFGIAYSPDETHFAAAQGHGADRLSRLCLWDTRRFGEGEVLLSSGLSIRSPCFSPDGQQLACCVTDGSVRLFDLGTRQQRASWRLSAEAVSFVPAGGLL